MRSTREILEEVDSIELNQMGKVQLKAYVSRLKRTASQRLKRLQAHDIEPLRYEEAFRRIKKGDDINTLRRQFVYLSKFLNRQTSTIRGYNRWSANVASALGVNKLSKKQIKRLFRLKAYADELPVSAALGSKELMEALGEFMARDENKKGSIKSKIDDFEKYLIERYEKIQENNPDSEYDLRISNDGKYVGR